MEVGFKIFFVCVCLLTMRNNIEAQRSRILADRAFEQLQYAIADSLYSTCFEKYNDTTILIKRAYTNRLMGKHREACDIFERAGKWVYRELNWCTDYATSLQQILQTDSSILVAQRCLNLHGNSDRLSHLITSQTEKDLWISDSTVSLSEIFFEGFEEMSSAVPYQDKIIFTAAAPSTVDKDSWTGLSYYRLHIGDPATGKSLPINIEMASYYHIGGAAIYDNNMMYFTSNSLKANKDDEHHLHIAKAGKTIDGKWVHSGIFPYSSPEFSTAYPCFSSNDSIIVFSADMKGGKGGFDLYLSRWSNGKWMTPEHLKEISTSGKDIFPWIDADDTLYFATDGWNGMGGLDVYKISLREIKSTTATNLGKPYNSPADDFSYITHRNKTYISSNRSGKDKIYLIKHNY
jgi:hypothetical protein